MVPCSILSVDGGGLQDGEEAKLCAQVDTLIPKPDCDEGGLKSHGQVVHTTKRSRQDLEGSDQVDSAVEPTIKGDKDALCYRVVKADLHENSLAPGHIAPSGVQGCTNPETARHEVAVDEPPVDLESRKVKKRSKKVKMSAEYVLCNPFYINSTIQKS